MKEYYFQINGKDAITGIQGEYHAMTRAVNVEAAAVKVKSYYSDVIGWKGMNPETYSEKSKYKYVV